MRAIVLTLLLLSGSPALAGPPELDLEADVSVGMRIGASGLATARVWRGLDLGLQLVGVTDFSAGAPKTITFGLDTRLNLRLGLRAAVGWRFEGKHLGFAVHAVYGPELFLLKEHKSLPALESPAVYSTRALLFSGGLRPSFHWLITDRWGANLALHFPLPLSPLGGPQITRIAVLAGVTYRVGPVGGP